MGKPSDEKDLGSGMTMPTNGAPFALLIMLLCHVIWGGIGFYAIYGAYYWFYFGPSCGFLAVVLGVFGVLFKHQQLLLGCMIAACVAAFLYFLSFVLFLVDILGIHGYPVGAVVSLVVLVAVDCLRLLTLFPKIGLGFHSIECRWLCVARHGIRRNAHTSNLLINI